jgi:hypothetical protein
MCRYSGVTKDSTAYRKITVLASCGLIRDGVASSEKVKWLLLLEARIVGRDAHLSS